MTQPLNDSYTFPSVAINSVTYTAKRWNQFPTISYLAGGVAGSEVVTMDSNFNIFVTIQSGTSTNLQIKTAILATANPDQNGLTASDMVSVAITGGHNSDTNVASSVVLSGGTPAIKSSLILQGLKFTAATAGTAGNSIRVRVTSGATAGAEVVSVSGSDITIQVAVQSTSYSPFSYPQAGVDFSTKAQIIAAFNAVGAATTLAAITLVNGTESVESTSVVGYTNLAGGLAAAHSHATYQGVTVTASASSTAANGVVVTFKGGATAGSETVVDNADGSFLVGIQSGVSTQLQVKTALNNDAGFSALYAATDAVDGTAVSAAYEVPLTGATSNFGLGFYTDQSITTLTASYQYLAFGNVMSFVSLYNDDASGNNKLSFSWDGINVHGILTATENVTYTLLNKSGIYVKYVTGSPAFRIFATNSR